MPNHIVVESTGPRFYAEHIDVEDDFKRELYPEAAMAITRLAEGPDSWGYTRAHLLGPTVFLVAATATFSRTKDRERGAKLLRALAELLEEKRLGEIPWGPKNPVHKPVFRELVAQGFGPDLATGNERDEMLVLMETLGREFNGAIDGLLDRFEGLTDGANERLLLGFLTQFMLRRYGQVEEPKAALSTVLDQAVDLGWVEPRSTD
ncbi:MAG TPA: hypothetical protein VGL66_15065 [Caulobacteraceae bacterium]|jgi:hypothetical protein